MVRPRIVRQFVVGLSIVAMFLSSTPREVLFADEAPSSAVTPPTNYSAPVNPAWDLSTLTIYESTDVDIIVDTADDGTPIISAIVDSAAEFGTFAFSIVSDDGFESMHCTGFVEDDGSIMYQARQADLFTAMSSNAGAAAWAEADSEPGFWEGYWYFLSGGSAPADPAWLNYGSEAGFIVAGVATGGAGLVAVTGVGAGVTFTAGGVATAVGTEIVDTVAEEGISYATGVPVILPMSPIDLVQDSGRLIVRRLVRAPSPRIANPADEIAGNFNPSDYVDDGFIPAGPYFGVDDAGQAVAEDFAEAYGNGIQEIFVTSDKFDEMLQSGTIVPDGYYPDGTAVYAPSELLEQFNVDILTGPTNIYHPPKP